LGTVMDGEDEPEYIGKFVLSRMAAAGACPRKRALADELANMCLHACIEKGEGVAHTHRWPPACCVRPLYERAKACTSGHDGHSTAPICPH
jgi:hypothetical protein